MITIRRSEERRHIDAKGQQTWMTFDRQNDSDPLKNGFGVLKLLNEEVLPPGTGFVLQTHHDMVVLTYVGEGIIVYKGPLGGSDTLTGKEFYTTHSPSQADHFLTNASPTVEAHVFQSGFNPLADTSNKRPKKKLFTYAERNGVLKLIASPDGRESSLHLQQDVQIYSTFIQKGNHMIHELYPGRTAWLHVVKGSLLLNGFLLQSGDGAGLSNELSVSFTAQEATEILLFDLGNNLPKGEKAVVTDSKDTVVVL